MDRKKFGELIIRLRQTRNMKQKELADAMNVSTTAVSKWERGINYPDVESMEQLAEIFHLTIAELFEPEETLQKLLQGQPQQGPCPQRGQRVQRWWFCRRRTVQSTWSEPTAGR